MEMSEMKPRRSASRNSRNSLHHSNQIIGAETEDGESSRIGCCGWILTIFSFLIILATIPLSLLFIIKTVLDDATDRWGIIVERVEIKDGRLPIQLQRSMAVEAEAARDANAKVIAADGEKNASHAFKEAAEIIDVCPTALQLRYLQSLHSISAETNSTIIFPLPVDILHGFLNKRNIEP